jgi:hypothetical protein
MRGLVFQWAAASIVAAPLTPAQAAQPGVYEISAETLMPHLEDNLRYARTTGRECISDGAASGFFPILRHHSLNGCKLAAGERRGYATYHSLACDGTNGTIGTAELRGDAEHVAGTLKVQMGGKNMTFSQRIVAKRIGDCNAEQ